MKYRSFGRTGWQVSEIGFGAWAIGADWGKVVSEEDSLGAIYASLDNGVNLSTQQMCTEMVAANAWLARRSRDIRRGSMWLPKPGGG